MHCFSINADLTILPYCYIMQIEFNPLYYGNVYLHCPLHPPNYIKLYLHVWTYEKDW